MRPSLDQVLELLDVWGTEAFWGDVAVLFEREELQGRLPGQRTVEELKAIFSAWAFLRVVLSQNRTWEEVTLC